MTTTTVTGNASQAAASATRTVSPFARRWDRLGIVASVACAIHCMVAPFLLLLLPAAGSIWSHPSVHWVLAALVLPLALLVVYRGFRIHRRRSAIICAAAGAAFIVAGLLIPIVGIESAGATIPLNATHIVQPASSKAAAAPTCTDTCCPSIAVDPQTGSASFHIPAESLVTIIGSILLVAAHGINLHGCHCFSRAPQVGTCGCPNVS